MFPSKLIVLKFGGSVLRDASSVPRAVHEVYRWRRDGYAVVAVVSALQGQTDERLQVARELDPHASDHNVAALLAGGELHSSALLGTLLHRAGIPNRVLWPGAVELIAEGAALDAMPSTLNPSALLRAFHHDEVVVFPGFVGRDVDGRCVTFGRGGSDLKGLVLAERLGATRCRLIKDVDSLYVSDPAAAKSSSPGATPDRFASASYATAHSTALVPGASILQPKAVSFAQSKQLTFEIASINGHKQSVISQGPTRRVPVDVKLPPLPVGLYGLGIVGDVVLRAL
jgi:aspartokinase